MLKRMVTRVSAVIAAAMVMVLGMTTLAWAGNTVEYITFNGIDRGKITHIDDGDKFEVCDLYPDGHGVYGYLDRAYFPGAPWTAIDSQDDGGDPGCDYFQYNVLEVYPAWDNYRLKICWNGYCDVDYFHE